MFSSTGFSLLTFLVLIGGIIVHMAKQFRTVSVAQSEMTLHIYLIGNWPETLTGVIGSLVLWVGLPELAEKFPELAGAIGLGAQVGVVSSFICGFIGNSAADLIGKRAASLTGASNTVSKVVDGVVGQLKKE